MIATVFALLERKFLCFFFFLKVITQRGRSRFNTERLFCNNRSNLWPDGRWLWQDIQSQCQIGRVSLLSAGQRTWFSSHLYTEVIWAGSLLAQRETWSALWSFIHGDWEPKVLRLQLHQLLIYLKVLGVLDWSWVQFRFLMPILCDAAAASTQSRESSIFPPPPPKKFLSYSLYCDVCFQTKLKPKCCKCVHHLWLPVC